MQSCGSQMNLTITLHHHHHHHYQSSVWIRSRSYDHDVAVPSSSRVYQSKRHLGSAMYLYRNAYHSHIFKVPIRKALIKTQLG